MFAGVLLCFLFALLDQNNAHRIAFGSCANPSKGGKIWKLIESFHPQHLVLLGDVMYADREALGRVSVNTPTKILREYDMISSDKNWQSLQKSIDNWSITYDDHDYGVDNGDKTFLHRNFSIQAFKNFAKDSFENADSSGENGVYSSKLVRTHLGSHKDVEFLYKVVLMDSRSNKDPKGTPNGDLLGEEQWTWLATELMDPAPDLILLGSSVQILADDTIVEENWSEFPEAKKRLLSLVLAASQNTNVILLSGDIHRAEVGRATCMLTSNTSKSESADDIDVSVIKAITEPIIDLWELTSSGLSHTLMQSTDDKASADDAIVTRSWWRVLASWIYHAAYPGSYREVHDTDSFWEIHFALLDITLEESPVRHANAVEQKKEAASINVQFRVISHRGEAVIVKSIPLRHHITTDTRAVSTPNDNTIPGERKEGRVEEGLSEVASLRTKTESGLSEGNRETLFRAWQAGELTAECAPHRGELPLWRWLKYRAIIAFSLLVIIVLPLLAVMWLVGASIYYICLGSELARRDRIERQYREHKKNS